MEHIAIDLGGRESQICIRRANGEIVKEKKEKTHELRAFLSSRTAGRVILETCAEAFAVADDARASGHEVVVVPATLVRSLGVGERGIKTDRKDAQVLSQVSTRTRLPSVHIPSREARQLKSELKLRESLVETRTKLVNAVRGYLRQKLMRIKTGKTSSFPLRVRDAFKVLKEDLPLCIAGHLKTIDCVTEQLTAADAHIQNVCDKNPIMTLLTQIPGVGPITAATFVAAVDDRSRFPDAHRLESYLGLTPGERSSSAKIRRTGITKAGAGAVRRTLSQACWSMWRTRPCDPLVLWAKDIGKRRGKQIMIVAMMRKLAGIMFAMWRDQSSFKTNLASPKHSEISNRMLVKNI